MIWYVTHMPAPEETVSVERRPQAMAEEAVPAMTKGSA